MVVLSGKLSNPETARQLTTLTQTCPRPAPTQSPAPKLTRRRTSLTEKELRHAVSVYAAGQSVKGLAKELDVHHTVISKSLKQAGVRLRQTGLSEAEVEAARTLRALGWTYARIAERYNCGVETVRRRLRHAQPEGRV